MSKYWAIAVGINHYPLLQPLYFAQQDAQFLCEALVDHAGFLPDRCFLLTDTSPALEDASTDPTHENLQHWLAALRQKVQPEDWLWCFFSGYGICIDGQDYLLPIDADPNNLAETGISARSLFQALNGLPTKNVLVLLDINRAQAGSPEKVGNDTTNVAREFGIPTLLSCRPEQFSHEAPALNHGLFTQALIEGLRSHQCSTLAELENFLKARLPQLCDHNDRPAQDPVLIVPSPDPLYKLIMPLNWAEIKTYIPPSPNPFAVAGGLTLNLDESDYFAIDNPSNFESQPIMGATTTDMPDLNLEPEPFPTPTDASEPAPEPTPPAPTQQESSEGSDQMIWERILFGGSAILVLLLLGVLFRNWSAFMGGQQTASKGEPTQTVRTTPPNPVSPSPNSGSPVVAVPQGAPSSPPPAAEKNSQQLLNEARSLIKPTSATQARQAIQRALQVPKDDPLYNQAQQDIDRWSRDILEIARARAEQGNLRQAIAAAQLVPSERPQVYAEAQKAIRQWRQRLR